MSSKAIVEIWENTSVIFIKYHIPIVDQPLDELVESDLMPDLRIELNHLIGSSTITCIEGG
jgi:hypothetical protein